MDNSCWVCERRCSLVAGGSTGFCGAVYRDEAGILCSNVHGRLARLTPQPISYLPFSFWDGGPLTCYALSTVGCNQRCVYCTNADIAHIRPAGQLQKEFPAELVAQAAARRGYAIATDYTENVGLFEYIVEVFTYAQPLSVPTILTTNGLFTPKYLNMVLPVTSAVRVDIKGWRAETLRKLGFWFDKQEVDMPLTTARLAQLHGCYLELTFPVIPEVNDSPEEITSAGEALYSALGDVPITLVPHWRGNHSDMFPEATTEHMIRFSSILASAGFSRIAQMEGINVHSHH